jgi:hypothetical protein
MVTVSVFVLTLPLRIVTASDTVIESELDLALATKR